MRGLAQPLQSQPGLALITQDVSLLQTKCMPPSSPFFPPYMGFGFLWTFLGPLLLPLLRIIPLFFSTSLCTERRREHGSRATHTRFKSTRSLTNPACGKATKASRALNSPTAKQGFLRYQKLGCGSRDTEKSNTVMYVKELCRL